MGEVERIKLKPSYISIDFFRKIFSGGAVFVLVSFLGALLFAIFAKPLYFSVGVPLSLGLSTALLVIILFSERILKNLTKRWDYLDFCHLQKVAFILFSSSLGCGLVLFSALFIFRQIALYWLIAFLVAFLILFLTVPYLRFYNAKGEVVLTLQGFAIEFNREPNNADFSRLDWVANFINKIASEDNIEINSHQLCLGLSIGCLQDKDTTIADLGKIVKWVENPRGKEEFTNFKNIVKKCIETANSASKEGMAEKRPWNFEHKFTVLNVLIVPLLVAVITLVFPELAKLF